MKRQSHAGSFPAMSTTVAVMGVGITERYHHRAMTDVAAEVELWQQLFSRFRPDSMLSRVNASDGHWVQVNDVFMGLLESARDAVVATEGRFNPAILPALESHGYDRTFDAIGHSRPAVAMEYEALEGEDVWKLVEIDWSGSRVLLPPGMRIDFGGIAKGALADRLADRFEQWPGGVISIGGDLRVWGTPPEGDMWRIGIEHPLDSAADIATVELPATTYAAIATSSRTKRAWLASGAWAHHLIDPTTSAPIDSSVLAVTACATSAMAAEITTKNLMVASAHGPIRTNLLLDAQWALTVSDSLDLAHYSREAA